jgi:hypothetical protein
MTFEEFFKKKKIDLPALEKEQGALFFEFKNHFGQMGEKSFDHSKKYWFNKLRRQFPAPVEAKTEKVNIGNPISQQTITESLSETMVVPPPAPKLGFAPKFKAVGIPKPVSEVDIPSDKPATTVPESIVQESPVVSETPKLGFVPKFKMKPKFETDQNVTESTPTASSTENITPEAPVESIAPKPAYVPKFKMKPKVETRENTPKSAPEPSPTENTEPKPANKPRFNMKNMPAKNEE